MADAQYLELLQNADQHPHAGEILLRDLMLPELLGERAEGILYFAGRSLAAHLNVPEDQIASTFAAMGFGELSPEKIKNKVRTYTLGGPVVNQRLHLRGNATDFRLEAGFLAQLVQQALGHTVEGACENHHDHVILTLSVDPGEEQPFYNDLSTRKS
ncbi:DUF2507 domain-containing protein [Lacticaseibacillus thailandensis]|nr:DUF2507 domain-containing protein [Lacticaseibacillus thailandensis]